MRRHAFTLIELLAALALAAILLGATLRVIGTLGATRRVMSEAVRSTAFHGRLDAWLRRDLAGAHTLTFRDGVLTLEGWCGRDATGEHLPAVVVYRLLVPDHAGPASSPDVASNNSSGGGGGGGGLGWVVREQRLLLDLTNAPPTRDVLVMGVTSWDLTPEQRDQTEAEPPASPPANPPADTPADPGTVIRIGFADAEAGVFERTYPVMIIVEGAR